MRVEFPRLHRGTLCFTCFLFCSVSVNPKFLIYPSPLAPLVITVKLLLRLLVYFRRLFSNCTLTFAQRLGPAGLWLQGWASLGDGDHSGRTVTRVRRPDTASRLRLPPESAPRGVSRTRAPAEPRVLYAYLMAPPSGPRAPAARLVCLHLRMMRVKMQLGSTCASAPGDAVRCVACPPSARANRRTGRVRPVGVLEAAHRERFMFNFL